MVAVEGLLYILPSGINSNVEFSARFHKLEKKRGGGVFFLMLTLALSTHWRWQKFLPEEVRHLTDYQHLLNWPPVYNHSQCRCANLLLCNYIAVVGCFKHIFYVYLDSWTSEMAFLAINGSSNNNSAYIYTYCVEPKISPIVLIPSFGFQRVSK